jgi:hypothetical protein
MCTDFSKKTNKQLIKVVDYMTYQPPVKDYFFPKTKSTGHQPSAVQQYFSLSTNQHQPQATTHLNHGRIPACINSSPLHTRAS